MAKRKYELGTKEFLSHATEQICKERREIDIINRKPDKIAVALLLLSSTDEAVEVLRAVYSADNIDGSQIEEVGKELFRLNERIQVLLRAIKVSTSTESV